MDFPTNQDIQRIIDMDGYDPGFFSIAIYSFIEKYMIHSLHSYYGDFDETDKFAKLLSLYISKYLFPKYSRNYERVSDSDLIILNKMKDGKNNANAVRHNFAYLTEEELKIAINDLIEFCRIDKQEALSKKFAILKNHLKDWDLRKNPYETSKELLTVSKQLDEYIKTHNNDLEKIKELELLNKQREALENENGELLEEYEKSLVYIDNMKRMTFYTKSRNDYEHAILRPSPEQETAIKRISEGRDFIIKGSAGTGKSFVLLKAIEKFSKNSKDEKKFHFLTYTNSLVKYNDYVSKLMNLGIKSDSISTADKYLKDIFKAYFPNKDYDSYNQEKKLHNLLCKDLPEETHAVIDQFIKEMMLFIWPNQVSESEYLDDKIRRTGLETPLKEKVRKQVWSVYKKLDKLIEEDKVWPSTYAQYKLVEEIKKDSSKIQKLDYIFVDEAQDLNVSVLSCLKLSCNNIILAGDTDQSIYQIHPSWKRAGIEIQGNSIILKTNFRNTIQINDFAEEYRKLIPGMNQESNPSPFRAGPPVEFYELECQRDAVDRILNDEDIYQAIKAKVDFYINVLGYSPENLCIIALENIDFISKKFNKLGLELDLINNIDDFSKSNKVRITTAHSAKGLDFPVVFIMADKISHIHEKDYDKIAYDKYNRNLFYVAMTRAMDSLSIFTWKKEDQHKAIEDMKDIYNLFK